LGQKTLDGIRELKGGQRNRAIQLLISAIKEDPHDEVAWLWLAACTDDLQKQRTCLLKVLEINPHNESARRRLAQISSLPKQAPTAQTPLPAPAAASPPPTHQAPIRKIDSSPKEKQIAPVRGKQTGWKHEKLALWVSAIILTLLAIAVIVIKQPSLLAILDTGLSVEDQVSWLVEAPSAQEKQILSQLSRYFDNPNHQDYIQIERAEQFQTFTTPATPVKLDSVLEGGFKASPTGYGLTLSLNEQTVLVLYRGYVAHLQPGDRVHIQGFYYQQEDAIVAHELRQLAPVYSAPQSLSLWVMRLAVLDFIWMMFCVTTALTLSAQRPKVKARSAQQVALILALCGFLLYGCTLDITTVINRDGSGMISLTARDSQENMDFILQVPGMADYLGSITRQLELAGMQTTSWQTDQDYFIYLQRRIDRLAELSDQDPTTDTWINVQSYDEGGWKVTRYLALIDTQGLYRDNTNLDNQIVQAMQSELDGITINYRLRLPGEIVYHNASQDQPGTPVWQIKMRGQTQIIAEAREPLSTSGDYMPGMIPIGLGIIFLLSTLLLIVTLFKRGRAKR